MILSTIKRLAAGSGTGRQSLGHELAALPPEIPIGETVKEIGILLLDGRLVGTRVEPCLFLSLSG